MFVNTPKNLFSPDCSFKIHEKPSKFSESVRVVLSVSAWSLTTLTLCRRIVMTTRLHNFWKYQIFKFFVTFFFTGSFFYFFQSKIISRVSSRCSFLIKKSVDNLVTLFLYDGEQPLSNNNPKYKMSRWAKLTQIQWWYATLAQYPFSDHTV